MRPFFKIRLSKFDKICNVNFWRKINGRWSFWIRGFPEFYRNGWPRRNLLILRQNFEILFCRRLKSKILKFCNFWSRKNRRIQPNLTLICFCWRINQNSKIWNYFNLSQFVNVANFWNKTWWLENNLERFQNFQNFLTNLKFWKKFFWIKFWKILKFLRRPAASLVLGQIATEQNFEIFDNFGWNFWQFWNEIWWEIWNFWSNLKFLTKLKFLKIQFLKNFDRNDEIWKQNHQKLNPKP